MIDVAPVNVDDGDSFCKVDFVPVTLSTTGASINGVRQGTGQFFATFPALDELNLQTNFLSRSYKYCYGQFYFQARSEIDVAGERLGLRHKGYIDYIVRTQGVPVLASLPVGDEYSQLYYLGTKVKSIIGLGAGGASLYAPPVSNSFVALLNPTANNQVTSFRIKVYHRIIWTDKQLL